MLPPDASNDKCQDSLLEATGVNLTYIVNFRRVCHLSVHWEKKFISVRGYVILINFRQKFSIYQSVAIFWQYIVSFFFFTR